MPTACGASMAIFAPVCSKRSTTAPAAGSSARSLRSSEFSKYSATRGKALRGQMHQLKELRAGLLLGRVDVLIALDHVDVDGQLFRPPGERRIAGGDLRVALGAEVPDGGRILHQERELVLLEHRQGALGVGADQVAHPGVEAVVDVGEDQVEVRLAFAAHLVQAPIQ